MAARNPGISIGKLREGGADVIPTTDLTQADPGSDSRYPLGNTTFAVDGASAGVEWPTQRGQVNTSKSGEYFATQVYTPVGDDYDYTLQRKWDDSVIDPDETGSPDGGLNYTRWKPLLNPDMVGSTNGYFRITMSEAYKWCHFRTNYWMNPFAGNGDLSFDFEFDAQSLAQSHIGSETGGSSKKFYLGFPAWLNASGGIYRHDLNGNIQLSDFAACFGIWWAENTNRFEVGMYVWSNGYQRQVGVTQYNPAYEYWRLRYLESTETYYFYAKVNPEDSWTLLASEGYRTVTCDRYYIKFSGGHQSATTFLSTTQFIMDYINVDYSLAGIVWEVPITGLWSTWKTVKDAAVVEAEQQTYADDAVSTHNASGSAHSSAIASGASSAVSTHNDSTSAHAGILASSNDLSSHTDATVAHGYDLSTFLTSETDTTALAALSAHEDSTDAHATIIAAQATAQAGAAVAAHESTYDHSSFAVITTDTTAPTSPSVGDLWIDTST